MITAVALSRRIAAVLDEGTHPATAKPINDTEACGSCAHWRAQVREDGTSSGRTKCTSPDRVHHRFGPNLPASTPACALYEPTEPMP